MAERQFKCHACGQPTQVLDIADPREWKDTKEKISVSGCYSLGRDTGEVRTVTIGGKELLFLRREVQEHWPHLDWLISREDSMP